MVASPGVAVSPPITGVLGEYVSGGAQSEHDGFDWFAVVARPRG